MIDRKVLQSDTVYQSLVTGAARNPRPDAFLHLAVHCENRATEAYRERRFKAAIVYYVECSDWLNAYANFTHPEVL